MTIESNIEHSVLAYSQKDFDESLLHICLAIDATSKLEFPGLGCQKRYIKFISSNLPLIFMIMTGQKLAKNIHFDNYFQEWLDHDEDKCKKTLDLSEIIYLVIRCNVVHRSTQPVSIKEEPKISLCNRKLALPASFVLALTVITIVAPTNISKALRHDYDLCMFGEQYSINSLFGRRDYLCNIAGISPHDHLPS